MKKPIDSGILGKAQSIDLTNTRARIKRKKRWSDARVDNAIEGYRHFLYFCALFPGNGLSPTPDVDEIWHDHILHMQKYEDDCKMLCGWKIYHRPILESERLLVTAGCGSCSDDCDWEPTECDDKSDPKIVSGKLSFKELHQELFETMPT